MTAHQQKQLEVINAIEAQVLQNSLQFSTVAPVEDFANDPRMTLTSVHLPADSLKAQIQKEIIEPLLPFSSGMFPYPNNSLHMTIKNVRVINDPPQYTQEEIEKAKQVFAQTIPTHTAFKVYFYRLLLFPNNLALIGTTDPELDEIALDLDHKLKIAGVPDDKKYINDKYFFSNMTLLRFSQPVSAEFKNKVAEISQKIHFEPYTVDSVTLLTSNAVLKFKEEIGTWKLR